jgi:hypothetical protein
VTESAPSACTFEGGLGYACDDRTALYFLAVSYMGHDTFCETAKTQRIRLRDLVHVRPLAQPRSGREMVAAPELSHGGDHLPVVSRAGQGLDVGAGAQR